jgi:hypothetical protein
MNIEIAAEDLPSCDGEMCSIFSTPEPAADLDKAALCRAYHIIRGNRVFALPCKQWRVCQACFKYRVETWLKNVKDAVKLHGRMKYKKFTHREAPFVRRSLSAYLSFPLEDGVVIISPEFEDGDDWPMTSDFGQISLLKKWVCTPVGFRISRTSNTIVREEGRKPPKQTAFFTTASREQIRNLLIEMDSKFVNETDYAFSFTDWTGNDLAFGLLFQNAFVKLASDAHEDLSENRGEDKDSYDTIFDETFEREMRIWKSGGYGGFLPKYSEEREAQARERFRPEEYF